MATWRAPREPYEEHRGHTCSVVKYIVVSVTTLSWRPGPCDFASLARRGGRSPLPLASTSQALTLTKSMVRHVRICPYLLSGSQEGSFRCAPAALVAGSQSRREHN